MMLRITTILFLISSVQLSCAQAPETRPKLSSQEFDKSLVYLLNFSVPVIGVEELSNIQDEVFIFDTRKREEYQVSHISGAVFLGYKEEFNPKPLKTLAKDSKIVLYCSVGYRSEKIGEKLQEAGFTNVHNLYGSIFEWVNQKNPIVDAQGKETFKIHTYNKVWGKWLENNQIQKVW